MNRKRIFYTILIVLTVAAIWDIRTNLHLGEVIEQSVTYEGNNVKFEGETASRETQTVILASGLHALELANQFGDVEIIGEKRDDISVTNKLTVYAVTQAIAIEYLDELNLQQITRDGVTQLKVLTGKQPDGVNGVQSDFVVRMPEQLALKLDAAFGDINVESIKGAFTGNLEFVERIVINELYGATSLDVSYSLGEVTNIYSDLLVKSAFSLLNIQQVTGNMKLESQYSIFSGESLEGNLVYNGNFDELNLHDVGGDLTGKSRYSSLLGRGIGGLIDLNGQFADIKLEEVQNDVVITGSYNDIVVELEPIAAGYIFDVQLNNGNLLGNLELKSSNTDSDRRRYTGVYQTGQHGVRIVNEHGDVTLRVK